MLDTKHRVFIEYSNETPLKDLLNDQAVMQVYATIKTLCQMFGLKYELSQDYEMVLVNDIINEHGKLSGKEVLNAFTLFSRGKLKIDNEMRFVKTLQSDIIHKVLSAYKKAKGMAVIELNKNLSNHKRLLEEKQNHSPEEQEKAIKRTICKMFQCYIDDPKGYDISLRIILKEAYYFLERIELIKLSLEDKKEIHKQARTRVSRWKYKDDHLFKNALQSKCRAMAMPQVFESWIKQGLTPDLIMDELNKHNYYK